MLRFTVKQLLNALYFYIIIFSKIFCLGIAISKKQVKMKKNIWHLNEIHKLSRDTLVTPIETFDDTDKPPTLKVAQFNVQPPWIIIIIRHQVILSIINWKYIKSFLWKKYMKFEHKKWSQIKTHFLNIFPWKLPKECFWNISQRSAF